jgi:hypothetical protein
MDTEEVAEFICKTSFADIPGGSVDAANRLILDFRGAAIAGSNEPDPESFLPMSRMLKQGVR